MPAWTVQSEYQLLLAIITLSDAPAVKWPEVAKLLGPGYTAEAARYACHGFIILVDTDDSQSQHFRKIRVKATGAKTGNGVGDGDGDGDDPAAAASSPKSKAAPTRKRKSPQKNQKGALVDDDQEASVIPIKKQKQEVKLEAASDGE